MPPAGNKRALAPVAQLTPPTSPVAAKKSRIAYSSTDEALEDFNKERETDTLAYWYHKQPSPTITGIVGQTGRFNVRFDKRRSVIVVGMVIDHDVNIKKEVPPHDPLNSRTELHIGLLVERQDAGEILHQPSLYHARATELHLQQVSHQRRQFFEEATGPNSAKERWALVPAFQWQSGHKALDLLPSLRIYKDRQERVGTNGTPEIAIATHDRRRTV